ncbi:hypothetical protein TWF281_011015 [Arthrobotrys megalospora]
MYRLLISLILAPKAWSTAPEKIESDINSGNFTTLKIKNNGTDAQLNDTSTTGDLTIANSTWGLGSATPEIRLLNYSIPYIKPTSAKPEDTPSINMTNVGNLTDPKQEISTSSVKEHRYISPSTFYSFKVVCPTLSEILGDGPDFDRRMNQDPNQYRTFSSFPQRRPSATEDLEAAGIFLQSLLQICLDCIECDPQTGQLKIVPPGRCRSADTVGRCSNWLNCYCELELKQFIYREDLTVPEFMEIYGALNRIPNWIKRKFPDHRFTTLDGLSFAWWRDGWGQRHPLPIGSIWRGQVYDPDGPGPPEFAPDTAEPLPLYGPGPSQPARDYRWLVSEFGPGLWGIGGDKHFKRDNSDTVHGEIRGNNQDEEEEGVSMPIMV